MNSNWFSESMEVATAHNHEKPIQQVLTETCSLIQKGIAVLHLDPGEQFRLASRMCSDARRANPSRMPVQTLCNTIQRAIQEKPRVTGMDIATTFMLQGNVPGVSILRMSDYVLTAGRIIHASSLFLGSRQLLRLS